MSVAVPVTGRSDTALFGESGARIVVAVAAADTGKVEQRAAAAQVPCIRLGQSGGTRLVIAAAAPSPGGVLVDAPLRGGVLVDAPSQGGVLIDAAIEDLQTGWQTTLPAITEGRYVPAARSR